LLISKNTTDCLSKDTSAHYGNEQQLVGKPGKNCGVPVYVTAHSDTGGFQDFTVYCIQKKIPISKNYQPR